MKRLKTRNKNKLNTMNSLMFIVFFCVLVTALFLFNIYTSKVTPKITTVVNQKLDTIIYDFFNELITADVINSNSVNDILEITKNDKGEILTVNYNLEKTYTILTEVAAILKKGINDLENGKIDVSYYDKYLVNTHHNLVMNVPLFLGTNNVFLNSIGPKVPVLIDFNETLLTNIKTKVTNYGFNNALLEIYIIVDMQKLIITPVKEDNNKFEYEILIGALVVNGSVPEFYGDEIISSSHILDK